MQTKTLPHSQCINLFQMFCLIFQSPIQKLEEQNEVIGKSVKTIKTRLKEMQLAQEQLQNMLHAVVQKLDITLEDDAPDEFEDESLFLHHVFE